MDFDCVFVWDEVAVLDVVAEGWAGLESAEGCLVFHSLFLFFASMLIVFSKSVEDFPVDFFGDVILKVVDFLGRESGTDFT